MNTYLSFLSKKSDELSALTDSDNFITEWDMPLSNGPELSMHITKHLHKHPLTGQPHQLSNIIISLNDSYKWSRERIADWLDTLNDQPIFYPHVPNHKQIHRREIAIGPARALLLWSCGCFIYNNSSVMNEAPDDTADLAPF